MVHDDDGGAPGCSGEAPRALLEPLVVGFLKSDPGVPGSKCRLEPGPGLMWPGPGLVWHGPRAQ